MTTKWFGRTIENREECVGWSKKNDDDFVLDVRMRMATWRSGRSFYKGLVLEEIRWLLLGFGRDDFLFELVILWDGRPLRYGG
jgi:hypothetical protein